jgi:asparagine synthase (glutamine-hydrolysing)
MVSDVPVGAFLSGGLDSSAVVAFAREINPELRCFTIDISSNSNDGFLEDLPYAKRVAKHLGLTLDVVNVDSSQIAVGIEQLAWYLDEPLADPASINVFFISQLAKQQGIKVLLSGAGGDDLFSGYRRHSALTSESYLNILPRSLRRLLRNACHYLPSGKYYLRRLRKYLSGIHLDGDARLVHYFRWIERSDLYSLYTPSFRHALSSSQAEDEMLSFLSELPASTSCLERMLALEQRYFLADHNLNYTDKMSMAAGVEVRVPFLDLELVDFAASVPSSCKQRARQNKWILKKSMESYLPLDVIYRPKTGFGSPLRSWLKTDLRDWMCDTLSRDSLQRRGLFDPDAVHLLINQNHAGLVDASYTLFSLICIEMWCRYFIDCPSSRSLAPFLDFETAFSVSFVWPG